MSQKHSQKVLENAKKSFQKWQTDSSCALSQPNWKQEDQKNVLTESEKEWHKNALDKPDITYVTPGLKDHRYVGKVDGKSQYVQKRHLDILCGYSMIY